jgi:hypothetical protein
MARMSSIRSLALGALLALGCEAVPTDETPEGALQLFLIAMDRSEHESRARAEAYALLGEASRTRLEERAARATALARRRFEPWEMIAQGRYRLRFEARPGDGIEAEIHGDRAVVVVRGREGQIARVPMVREDEGWRIELAVPEMQHQSAVGPRPADER